MEPVVILIANDNWMEFNLRYVVDFKRRMVIKDMLFTRILDGVSQSNGKISMASATIQLVEAPTLDIRLHKG